MNKPINQIKSLSELMNFLYTKCPECGKKAKREQDKKTLKISVFCENCGYDSEIK